MTCSHPEKQAHRSKRAALKARDSLEGSIGYRDLALRPYRCECGSWHLGHPKPSVQAVLRKGSVNAKQARRRRTR